MISREIWRRGWDSNPRLLAGEPLFESGALSQLGNLSAKLSINLLICSILVWTKKENKSSSPLGERIEVRG